MLSDRQSVTELGKYLANCRPIATEFSVTIHFCDRICDRKFGHKFCRRLVQHCDRIFSHKIRSQITIPTEVHSTATEYSVTVCFPTEMHRIGTENSVTIQLSDRN